jgi:hypothetical protein
MSTEEFAVAMRSWVVWGQTETTYHRFARLESFTEGWHWLLLAAVVVAICFYVVRLYRRDSQELPRATALALVVLRLAALAGLLFYFLDLEKGTQRTLQVNSRAVLLVDVSQSMAQRDMTDASGREQTRSEAVIEALQQYQVIDRLRRQHDVAVYAFGDTQKPELAASFSKRSAAPSRASTEADDHSAHKLALWVARVGAGFWAAGLLLGLVAAYGATRQAIVPGEHGSWSLLAAVVFAMAGTILYATATLRSPQISLREILTGHAPAAENVTQKTSEQSPEEPPEPQVAWREVLAPRAQQTRLGDAVQQMVLQERGGPIAGIVLISDGQSNAGVTPSVAATLAQEAALPVHTVAVGSDRPPTNVRVVDIEAPARVYPGDRFEIKGYLQAFQMQGRAVTVRLMSEAVEGQSAADLEEEKTLNLAEDGVTQQVVFELEPPSVGKRRYTLSVVPPREDRNENDNSKSAIVHVVDQRNRVLILAGGPTREYQFVRNLLYRDRDTTTVVLLQCGEPGISQEGDELIFDFPRTESEMFAFDTVLAFDPDWQRLDLEQVRLLERWVSEQAGGLLLVAGPIYTSEWSRIRRGSDPRLDIVKALYPVQFSEGATAGNLGRTGGEEAWPLRLTRDGLSEKFLWLEDDPVRNEAAWASFPGVYGYFAVRDVKRGARVYAYFGDPAEASLEERLPVYWASHFYGSGRVFFAASGEMWRLRALDEAYFNRFYIKLVRWLSQGRLLRGSQRGTLMVDKERCFIGDHVVVNAVMTDAQRRPLDAPTLDCTLIAPDGTRQVLTLRRVEQSDRGGEYQEQFLARQEGDYRLELIPPESVDELLSVDIRCSSSAAETRYVVRNDAVLQELAQRTGGKAYSSLQQAFAPEDAASGEQGVVAQLRPQDQVTQLPGTPDRDFKRRLSAWLMLWIAGTLSLEWLVRRLNRLA